MNTILPIGSVVRIKEANQPVMIFGYLQQSSGKEDDIVDYVAVPYPAGNINITMQFGFQMVDIEEVLFEGYRSEEFKSIEMLLNFRKGFHELKEKSK